MPSDHKSRLPNIAELTLDPSGPGQPGHDATTGVVIGMILGFQDGAALVVFPGNPEAEAIPARSLARLGADDLGAEVAILFEDGNPMRPLIIGKLIDPAPSEVAPKLVADGQLLRLTAKERIELRVGRASILMEADGRITIRGTDVISQASRSNRIRGGSINLN
ncbi:DUF6484 domain-containing protein [Xinfangfangia sp. CPCC 101601]|uniref:DUF6484 domain-containing protein n=1 Tax=Pseudogemmobacter lacusdianii TaxID=3069608 RepID=A0ABU0VXQ1_9RHOB|nr:DUF6484 domain-containing protein [Xinfangfangia sp. CPCC 101601]MDQ2065685.1 DUF6484 domain-containing protein [Xinfangfangia sp. CPCC 101601]